MPINEFEDAVFRLTMSSAEQQSFFQGMIGRTHLLDLARIEHDEESRTDLLSIARDKGGTFALMTYTDPRYGSSSSWTADIL